MSGTKEMRTPRLLLRKHVEADAEPLHENFGKDPAMFEYSGWNPYATPAMAENTVVGFIASYGDPHVYAWAIEHAARLVGTIGAYDYDAHTNAIEVGMSIEKASWGKGFATEALAAVLHYLVEEEGIAIVSGWCASDNIGSRRVMEKAGMVNVDVEKGALAIGDATFDQLWYKYPGEGAETIPRL